MAKIVSVFLLLIMSCYNSLAQFIIHIKVKSVPASHVNDSIFIAGNFNQWYAGNEKFILIKKDSILSIDIPGLKEDVYQFKFTRGNWQKVESDLKGNHIENRLVKLASDTTLEYTIEGWQDDFKEAPKKHTASANVHIIDTAFFIPQLDRSRRIWVYLPADYEIKKNKKHYPVIYMHDAQNLFDESTSGYGEWGVDECLDTLIRNGSPASIVVGIDYGLKRISEYNPYYLEKFGEGEGDQYVDFLIKTLKPFIDKHYRTLQSKENTCIAGSSLGGLISYYALLKHPDVFGNAGIFSPAFRTAPTINALTDSSGVHVNGKLFFYMDALEGNGDLDKMKSIADKIGSVSNAVIYTVIDAAGRHNEQSWRKWFAEFYCWTMGNGFTEVKNYNK